MQTLSSTLGASVTADMDPPMQIWTPLPNFPFSIICITFGTLFYVQAFCLCSFQSQNKILQ